MKRRPWSRTEYWTVSDMEIAAELWEHGLTAARIGELLGRTKGAVQRKMERTSVKLGKDKKNLKWGRSQQRRLAHSWVGKLGWVSDATVGGQRRAVAGGALSLGSGNSAALVRKALFGQTGRVLNYPKRNAESRSQLT